MSRFKELKKKKNVKTGILLKLNYILFILYVKTHNKSDELILH